MHCDDGDELLETMADGFAEPGGRWVSIAEASKRLLTLIADENRRQAQREAGHDSLANCPKCNWAERA